MEDGQASDNAARTSAAQPSLVSKVKDSKHAQIAKWAGQLVIGGPGKQLAHLAQMPGKDSAIDGTSNPPWAQEPNPHVSLPQPAESQPEFNDDDQELFEAEFDSYFHQTVASMRIFIQWRTLSLLISFIMILCQIGFTIDSLASADKAYRNAGNFHAYAWYETATYLQDTCPAAANNLYSKFSNAADVFNEGMKQATQIQLFGAGTRLTSDLLSILFVGLALMTWRRPWVSFKFAMTAWLVPFGTAFVITVVPNGLILMEKTAKAATSLVTIFTEISSITIFGLASLSGFDKQKSCDIYQIASTTNQEVARMMNQFVPVGFVALDNVLSVVQSIRLLGMPVVSLLPGFIGGSLIAKSFFPESMLPGLFATGMQFFNIPVTIFLLLIIGQLAMNRYIFAVTLLLILNVAIGTYLNTWALSQGDSVHKIQCKFFDKKSAKGKLRTHLRKMQWVILLSVLILMMVLLLGVCPAKDENSADAQQPDPECQTVRLTMSGGVKVPFAAVFSFISRKLITKIVTSHAMLMLVASITVRLQPSLIQTAAKKAIAKHQPEQGRTSIRLSQAMKATEPSTRIPLLTSNNSNMSTDSNFLQFDRNARTWMRASAWIIVLSKTFKYESKVKAADLSSTISSAAVIEVNV